MSVGSNILRHMILILGESKLMNAFRNYPEWGYNSLDALKMEIVVHECFTILEQESIFLEARTC